MATGKDLLSKLKEKNGNTEKETISGRDLLGKIQAKAPQTDSLNSSATSPLSTGFNNFSAFKAVNDAQKSQKTQTRQTASQYMNHLKESNPDAYDYLANNNSKGSKAKQTLTGITNWYENAAKKAYDNSMSNTVGGNNPLNQMLQSGNYTAAKIVNSAANSIKTQTYKDLTEKYGMSSEEADFWEKNYDVINGIIDNANADYRRKEYISKYSDEVKDAMNEYVAAQYQNELNYGSDLITSIQYGKKAEDLREKLKAQGIDVYDNGEYQQLYEYLYQEYSNKTVDEAREGIKQEFEQNPAAIWGYNAIDVVTSPLQGIMSALGTQIDNATRMDKSQPSNTNGAWGSMQNLSTLTQEATNEQIEKMGEQYGIDPKYGQFAYGVGSSTAKSLYQMALGGAIAGEISPVVVKGLGLTGKAAEVAPRVIQQLTTLPSFGATAYATTLQQSLDMGLGEDQAQAYAIMSGINEMLYEELSLDKAYGNFAANAAGKVSWQKAIMNILAQAGIEGSEEVFTELSNRWADAIINVDFSQHDINVRNLVAQGYSEEEAEAIVAKQEKAQLLETFLAGAASGGITGVATTVAGRTKYNSAARSIVNDNVRNQAFAEEVRASAPEGTTAREIIDNAGNNPLTVNQVADIMESLDEYESQHGGMSTGELLVNTLERSGMNEEEAIKAANTLFEISEQDLSDALSEDEVEQRLKDNQPLTDDERYAIKTADEISDRNARIFEENPAMEQAYADLKAGRLTSPAEISGKARYIAEQERAEKFDNAVKPIRDTVQKVADTLTGKKGFVSGTTKNGNVNVLSFESVTKDGAIVNTNKGKADLYSIDFKTTPESVVLKSAAEIEDTNAANIMLTDYKGEDAQAYVAMSTQAFRMGQNGLPLSTLIDNPSEFVQNSLKELGDDRYSEHLLNMYEAGLKTRNEQEVQKVNKSKAAKAEKMDVDKSDKLIDLKEVLGNYASINVITDYTETKFNGSWTTENATLQTSSSSGNELAAIFHEMGEFSKALAPTEYNLYKDAVMSLAYEKLGAEKVDRIIKAYQDRYRTSGIESEQNKSYSDASDEFVNDFMAGIFSDEEGARQFVEHIANNENYSASEKASIFKTFVDWVNHLIDTIRDFLGKRQNLGGKTAMDLKKMGTDLTNIRQMALNAMDAAKAELQKQLNTEMNNIVSEDIKENTLDIPEETKFSLNTPVEQTDKLIALHNIYEDKLIKTIELGGFAMPSIAVTKSYLLHDNFGPVSVLFNKSTVRPNEVYSGDAYTPMFPRIDYEVNKDEMQKLRDEIKKNVNVPDEFKDNVLRLANRIESDVENNGLERTIEYLANDTDMMQYYLGLSGKAVNTQTKSTVKEMNPDQVDTAQRIIKAIPEIGNIEKVASDEIIQKYGDTVRNVWKQIFIDDKVANTEAEAQELADGITKLEIMRNLRAAKSYANNGATETIVENDYAGTRKAIVDAVDKNDYRQWLADKLKKIVSRSGIRNNKDTFTPSGNRRSFEQLHSEVTLENVVKAMLAEKEKGGAALFSANSIFGASTRAFKSIDEMKKEMNRLQKITDEEIKEQRKEFLSRLKDIAERMLHPGMSLSGAMDAINDAVAVSKTKAALVREMNKNKEWYYVDDDIINDVYELVGDIAKMPTTYFEAKPRRAVGFSEIEQVIVPDNSSQKLFDALDSNGISYTTYEHDNSDNRLEVLNNVVDQTGAAFSLNVPDEYGNDDVNNVVNRDGLIVSGLTYDAEGNLRLNNAEKISDAMWKKILTGINRAGYGFNNVQQLKERFGELAELGAKQGGYLLQQDQAEVFNKVFKIKPQTKTESDAERLKKIGTGAARFYGVTNDYKKAGYMTVSGSLLDFSDGQRTRVKDHREINEYLDEAGIEYGDDYSDSLITFMNLGNIRMQTYGIDISVKPTAQQKTALRAFFNSLNGEVTVDFSNEKGDSVGSAEYIERTSAARILNDIDAYFEDGTVPEGNANSLSRFYSIDVDSEGNSLSEQQIKFFEGSVIRDDEGKLMPMYHGTQEGGFTVFDVKKAKSGGHYGRGFYFASSPLSGYSDNLYKVYLNITNPISSVNSQKTFTKKQITDYVKAVADNEDYGIDNYGYGATVDSVVKSLVSKKSDFDIIADINLTCVGDFVEAVKLFNEVNETDYDGIVVETETVAFYPEQIKLTSNQNPTSDKDIRYSVDVIDIDGDIREVDYLTDIMNIRQHRAFMGVIDNTPKSKHLRSSDGEYIIPIENLLVYTDYDKDDIGISDIIVFNTDDATEIAAATDYIMMSEKGVMNYEQARRIIEGYIREGIVDRYSNADFGYSQKFDRGTERNKSRSDTYHSKKFEERERVSGKNKRNVKTKFSVDVPDNFDAAVDEVLNQVKESETKFADTMSRMMDFTREMPKNFAYNAARSLKDMYKSDFVIKKLAERIDKAFNYMRNTGSLSAEDLEYIRETVGTYVIDYVNDVDETESEQYKQFIDAVKTFDIALNNKQIAEIRGRYETYTDFKRRMSGRLSLNKNGTPLDTIWTEICDLSNGALSYGENSNTQAIALAEYIEGITPTARILKEKSYEDATLDVALEVMRLYAKETAKKDNEQIIRDEIFKRNEELAKRYKQRFNEAVVKAEAARALDIERLAREIDNLTQEEQDALNQFGASLEVETIRQMKAQYINRYTKLRQQKNDTIARIKSDFRNYRQTLRANRAKSETIAKLRKEVTALENIIKHPKASATKHVPVRLLKSAIALLNAISDQSSNEDVYNRLTDLADTYAEQKTQKNTADGADSHNFGFDVDERIAADIEEIKELYSGGTYYDMYTPDIERILEIVRALKTQIKNANNLIIDGQVTDAREVAVGAMGEVRDSRIADTRFTNAFNSYATPHLNAYREFRKLSGYTDGNMMKIFNDLDKASLKEMQIQQELGDIFNDVLEGSKNQKEIKRFISTKEQDLVDIGITDEHGKPVKVSRAMRMSIVMHTMNDSNMNHAIFGGFRVPDMSRVATNKTDAYGKYGKLYRFLDYTKYLEAYNNKDYGAMEKMVSESRKKMEALRNDLSEWEQKFLADAMEMFHNRTGEYINDTSITLKGYTIARVNKYFPIKTDTRFIDTDFSELVQNGTVEGMGMLKERVQSRKPIMLEDITDVIQRQIKNTSKYSAYAIPVRNFNLAMKQTFRDGRGDLTTLESVIENIWSGRDIKFLKDLLVDIQSGRKNEGWKFLNTLRGNFAGAVLSLNPSVAIKQAASYPTAAATLGYAPLAMAIKDMPKGFFAQKGIKELEEINPLLWYRNQGYATQDIADAKSSDLIKKLPPTLQKIVGWTQFMDSGTVRTLEYAAKHYVDLNRKDLQKGSEEYWQAVSDIFTKTVTETQPNYDTLHKADIIRNPDSMVKMLVMFKTQPMQNYGILYDSVGELNATIKRYAKNKTDANRKALGKALEGVARSFTSQALSAATFSAMSILANLMLHRWKKYRDDDDEWSWAMALSELGSGALSAFAGMFLGGSELLDIILYATGKSKFYDGISVSSLETVEDFVTNSTKVYKSVDKLWNAQTTADRDEAVKDIVKYGLKLGTDIGQFFGIPTGNIKNILSSIYFYTVDAANSIQAGGVQISSQSDITDWELKKQHQMMYDAFMNNDLDAYNKLMAEVVAEGGEEAEDNIEKKILSLLKADVVEGAIDDEKAVEMLMYTGMDEPNAYLKVGQWESGTTAKYGHLNDLMEEALGNMSSDNRKAVVTEIQMLVKSGTDKKNIASALKKEYGEDYKVGNNMVNLNALLRQALMAAGYTDSEATDMLKKWTK